MTKVHKLLSFFAKDLINLSFLYSFSLFFVFDEAEFSLSDFTFSLAMRDNWTKLNDF